MMAAAAAEIKEQLLFFERHYRMDADGFVSGINIQAPARHVAELQFALSKHPKVLDRQRVQNIH